VLPEIRIRFDDQAVLDALKGAPAEVMRELGRGTSRAAQKVARQQRRNAPKAHSTLTNSIRSARTGSLERIVGPTVAYAEDVINPISRQPRPPEQSILDWIKVKGIQPRVPGMPLEVLAGLIARKIERRGTPENTFLDDTAEQMTDRVQELLMGSAFKALQKAGLM